MKTILTSNEILELIKAKQKEEDEKENSDDDPYFYYTRNIESKNISIVSNTSDGNLVSIIGIILANNSFAKEFIKMKFLDDK
jgi:protease II